MPMYIPTTITSPSPLSLSYSFLDTRVTLLFLSIERETIYRNILQQKFLSGCCSSTIDGYCCRQKNKSKRGEKWLIMKTIHSMYDGLGYIINTITSTSFFIPRSSRARHASFNILLIQQNSIEVSD